MTHNKFGAVEGQHLNDFRIWAGRLGDCRSNANVAGAATSALAFPARKKCSMQLV